MLSDSGVDLRSGRSSSLLRQEAELEREIESAYFQREMSLRSNSTLPSEIDQLSDTLREKLLELDDLRSEIRKHEPTYAKLTQPEPLSSANIQQNILDEDTVLLEYRLSEPRSFLFAVDGKATRIFELPGGRSLTDQAQLLHTILTDVPEKITLNRSRLSSALSTLSDELLAPASEVLTKKRILIVAEGALQHIPFSALPHPLYRSDPDDVRLVDRHEITLAPSAWTLNIMRERFASRNQAPRRVAVLADPVFFDDPRLPVSTSRNTRTRSAASEPGPRLGRLEFSRYEAEHILEQVNDTKSMKALGFDATKSAALDVDLRLYQYIHFATHSIVDTNFPEMSSLVFSRLDRGGRELDAFMRIYDVYKLKLQAELVALSACRTAKGKEIRGEGLVGWTHGFMVAGAERVLVSLWDVDDESTSELMKLFYSKMFRDEMSPASALQQAQIEIREQSRWSAPYFWAGFVLQGDFL